MKPPQQIFPTRSPALYVQMIGRWKRDQLYPMQEVVMQRFEQAQGPDAYPYLRFSRRWGTPYGLTLAQADVWRHEPKVQDMTATEMYAVAYFNHGSRFDIANELQSVFQAEMAWRKRGFMLGHGGAL
jgi:hypothetical protein